MYKCPLCNFTTIRLFALKQHTRKNHVLTKCPVCKNSYIRLNQHLYTKYDIEHLMYCYLFSTYKIPKNVMLAIKRKLEVE